MLRVGGAASILVVVAGVLSASTALAHIDLLEPEARAHGTAARGDTDIDVNSNLKSGPCGQVATGRTERVTTYAPGQRITVRVREENAHVSYLRVSLDLDGEDFPLRSQAPAGPETQEVAEAAEAALGSDGLLAVVREDNDTPGFIHELLVTLPEVSCDRCTLQVLQFMYDDPAAPFYFQCADLVLSAAGGGDDAGAVPAPALPESAGSAGGSGNGASNAGAVAPTGAANGSAPAPGRGQAPGETAVSTPGAPAAATNSATASEAMGSPDVDAGGGCSLSGTKRGSSFNISFGFWAIGLALIGVRLPRRPRVGRSG